MAESSTVLIVDDYQDALEVWSVYLEAEGFRVVTAATGRQALQRIQDDQPDVVVLDLELPDLSGSDVARRVRASDRTRALPLIAATGCARARELDAARQAGFDLILTKPCDPVGLVHEIRRLMVDEGARRGANA